ncbi:MAG: serine/threonine-protein kinase [Myxococcota bacterium]|nr:serine/threonine-protein kinase [Myxococcota bacterium]
MLSSEEDLPVVFGKYVLTRLIATGGMAEIFLAHPKKKPSESLVIKRILPHLIESNEFVSMFLDEARIAAQLHHENIVEIFDVGRIEGSYFIAMEYVHGEDIRRIYNQAFKLQRSLPLSHSIRVIAEAAVGLGFAHRLPGLTGKPLGVVHRDVSPQNILVTYDGSVKVVDFGIAKAATKVSETRAGVLKGKYSYMSPEQAQGDGIDHRTDIFALGIILYETTTGTRLFKRHNELATLQAIMRCDIKPPSEVLQGYPVELEQILLKALALDVRDRYIDAEDFSRDLFQFLRNSGLFVERTDISQFMHELFDLDSVEADTSREKELPHVESPVVRKETTVERNSTETASALSVSPFQVQHIDETEALESSSVATGVDTGIDLATDDDFDRTEAHDEEKLNQIVEAPGFVDSPQFISGGDTVAESNIAHKQITPEKTLSEPAPVVESPAYKAERQAKDELETIAVVRAYAGSKSSKKVTQPEAKRTDNGNLAPSPIRNRKMPLSLLIGLISGIVGFTLIGRTLFSVSEEHAPQTEKLRARTAPLKVPNVPALKPISSNRTTGSVGFVTIRTRPNAAIMHLDAVLGTADENGKAGPFEFETGRARIRASYAKSGFERITTVYVKQGEDHTVNMAAREAKLTLKTNPGASVELNGAALNELSGALLLEEGSHHVLIRHTQLGKSFESMVRLDHGEHKVIDIDLRRVGEDL